MTKASPGRRARKQQSAAHCHKLVKETAVQMAHACYAALMQRNDWYRDWKAAFPGKSSSWLEDRWVKWKWGEFVEQGRAMLAQSLTRPMPEGLKSEIYDALLLDATLIRGRKNPDILLSNRQN